MVGGCDRRALCAAFGAWSGRVDEREAEKTECCGNRTNQLVRHGEALFSHTRACRVVLRIARSVCYRLMIKIGHLPRGARSSCSRYKGSATSTEASQNWE